MKEERKKKPTRNRLMERFNVRYVYIFFFFPVFNAISYFRSAAAACYMDCVARPCAFRCVRASLVLCAMRARPVDRRRLRQQRRRPTIRTPDGLHAALSTAAPLPPQYPSRRSSTRAHALTHAQTHAQSHARTPVRPSTSRPQRSSSLFWYYLITPPDRPFPAGGYHPAPRPVHTATVAAPHRCVVW